MGTVSAGCPVMLNARGTASATGGRAQWWQAGGGGQQKGVVMPQRSRQGTVQVLAERPGRAGTRRRALQSLLRSGRGLRGSGHGRMRRATGRLVRLSWPGCPPRTAAAHAPTGGIRAGGQCGGVSQCQGDDLRAGFAGGQGPVQPNQAPRAWRSGCLGGTHRWTWGWTARTTTCANTPTQSSRAASCRSIRC